MSDLTEVQYKALLVLYNECKELFVFLPDYVQEAFYRRLYQK